MSGLVPTTNGHTCIIDAAFTSPTWDVSCECGYSIAGLRDYAVACAVVQQHQYENREEA